MEDKNLIDKADDMLDKAEKNAEETANNVVDSSENAGNKIVDTTKEIIDNTVETAGEVIDKVVDTAENLVSGAADATSKVAETVIDAADNAIEGTVNAAGQVVDAAGNVISGAVNMAGNAVGSVADAVGDGVEEGASIFKKILPLLLLLLLAVLLVLFFTKSCNQNPAATVADAADSTAQTTTNVLDSATQAIVDSWKSLGDLIDIDLGNGVKIKAPANGFENSLLAFLATKNQDSMKSKWFNFDRLIFNSGSSELNQASNEQINNLAEILKAKSTTKVKIGGYTDNTGSKEANIKISTERAQAVVKALVDKGIDPARLSAEGYGPEHPVCPENDTEECKSKNRRVAVRISEF